MKKIRLIGRIDIKGPNLIKGVHFEGLRVIGLPKKYATQYCKIKFQMFWHCCLGIEKCCFEEPSAGNIL